MKTFFMNKKAAKPTLSGQRIKTRKRDEKEKLDPLAFRDVIIQGLNEAGNNLEAVSIFLDKQSSKLNYRAYADSLIHILLTGGLLAPGGSIIEGPDPTKVSRTDVCVFSANDDDETLLGYRQVFHLLIRRYRYLDKVFLDEMTNRIIPCMKGYKEHERTKLAKITAMFLAANQLDSRCLKSLFTESLAKDDLGLKFATVMFRTWLKSSNIKEIRKAMAAHGMEGKLMLLFPLNKRSMEHFSKHFTEAGIEQIIEYQKTYDLDMTKQKLQDSVAESINGGKPIKEIVASCQEMMKLDNLGEHEVVINVWNSIMSNVEWNKKEELMAEQALRHLRAYTLLLAAFTKSAKSEITLMIRIQEYCYKNMNFMKLFWKIIKLFYDDSVLSEEAIKLWYHKKHSSKGQDIFLEQTKKLVEWLESAETESDTDSEGESDEEDSKPKATQNGDKVAEVKVTEKTPEAEEKKESAGESESDSDAETRNGAGDAAEGGEKLDEN